MTDPFTPSGSEFRVGNVFRRAWEIFTRNFLPFSAITLVVALPNLLIQAGSETPSGGIAVRVLLSVLLSMILNTLGQAVIIYGAFQELRGHPVRLDQALQKGLARFLPILGLAVLAGFGIVLGFIILAVPGIILGILWSVATPACVVESLGPVASMRRSARLTAGHRWQIFGIFILLYIVNFAVSGPVALILGSAGPLVAAVGSVIWSAVWYAYYNSVLVMIYHDLRVAKEGVDTGQIAAVFD